MRLLLSTIAKVFYNERLREAVKLNREADLRYQMAGIRLADAENRYLELTKLASEGDFDGNFQKIWEELNKYLGAAETISQSPEITWLKDMGDLGGDFFFVAKN